MKEAGTVTREMVEESMRHPINAQALVVRERGEVSTHPLSPSEISERLRFIKQVMSENMTEGVDYGKVPGCGDKPGLFQPGAQKLSLTFQLNPELLKETVTDYSNYHRGYRVVVRVSSGSKFADGVGECSTLESRYRYRTTQKRCPSCGKESVFRSKNEGEGWFCWAKKGGCGTKFAPGSPNAKAIEEQPSGKVEHENPPDHWNTVQKMAFKRGFVHAIINATNTSELWSQDLEDIGAVTRHEEEPEPTKAAPAPGTQDRVPAGVTQVGCLNAIDWHSFPVPFGKNAGKMLGTLDPNSLAWYCRNYKVSETWVNGDGKEITKRPEQLARDRAFRAALDAAMKEATAEPELPAADPGAGEGDDAVPF